MQLYQSDAEAAQHAIQFVKTVGPRWKVKIESLENLGQRHGWRHYHGSLVEVLRDLADYLSPAESCVDRRPSMAAHVFDLARGEQIVAVIETDNHANLSMWAKRFGKHPTSKSWIKLSVSQVVDKEY